jgi:Outer membrane protein beta-barrel domain
MKRLLMVCLVLFVTNVAKAQVDFGPRFTVLSTRLNLEDPTAVIEEGNAQFGYQYGVYMRVNLILFYFQPELLFTNSESVVGIGSTDIDLSFNKIDLPVMLGLKLGFVRLQAGPTFSFLTSAKSKTPSGVVEDIKDNYNAFTWGYQAGVGVDLLRFVIDLKYEDNLSNFADAVPTGINTNQRQSQWVLAVGFKLFQ